MSATTTFTFKGYTLRPADAADLPLAETWTAWDRYHAGAVQPTFWLFQGPMTESYLLFDNKGPVFFFRIDILGFKEANFEWAGQMKAQVHLQFMAASCEEDRARIRVALVQGTAWLEEKLRGVSIEEICFDSEDGKLIAFCVKRLGFTDSGCRLNKRLANKGD